jgi:hypothetical protein
MYKGKQKLSESKKKAYVSDERQKKAAFHL